MRIVRLLFLLPFFLAATCAWASAVDDARKLHDEAEDSLRKMSGVATDPKAYAEVVRKLEKAQALLEEAAKTDPKGAEGLEQTVSAALFWARRFATVGVVRELRKPDARAPDPRAAEAAFRKAEEFERTHPGDDYAVALRWFQYADLYSGTDWSLRAHARALLAQARCEAAKKSAAPQTEDAKLIAEGSALLIKKDADAALAKFEQAKKAADTVLVERRIGHAYLDMGYKARDEYAAQYLPLRTRYDEAVSRGDTRAAGGLRSEALALVSRLKPLEEQAVKCYDCAQAAFQRGLDLAKGKDLDCEAHLGIICFARSKSAQPRARVLLEEVIGKYMPGNDEERAIHEYSRTLLTKLNAGVLK
ncbi:MAG: hypothetical protein NTW87_05230 [Planctomycetota bacterium]|nr:hypothetical protein [Planctomycetota bacterium]